MSEYTTTILNVSFFFSFWLEKWLGIMPTKIEYYWREETNVKCNEGVEKGKEKAGIVVGIKGSIFWEKYENETLSLHVSLDFCANLLIVISGHSTAWECVIVNSYCDKQVIDMQFDPFYQCFDISIGYHWWHLLSCSWNLDYHGEVCTGTCWGMNRELKLLFQLFLFCAF